MEHAAMEIGMDPWEFKLKNLNDNHPKLRDHINDLMEWANIKTRMSEVKAFNIVGIQIYYNNYFIYYFSYLNESVRCPKAIS